MLSLGLKSTVATTTTVTTMTTTTVTTMTTTKKATIFFSKSSKPESGGENVGRVATSHRLPAAAATAAAKTNLDLNRFSPKWLRAKNEKPNIKFEADGSNDNDGTNQEQEHVDRPKRPLEHFRSFFQCFRIVMT